MVEINYNTEKTTHTYF